MSTSTPIAAQAISASVKQVQPQHHREEVEVNTCFRPTTPNSTTGNRSISTAKKSTFSVIVFVAVFGLIEFTARVFVVDQTASRRFAQIQQIVVFLGTHESDLMLEYDEQRFWKLKPNVSINDPQNHLWQGTISNSLGFRNREFDLQKQDGRTRIVCFGDSSTFGIGTRMEHTWPSQLEAILNEVPGQNVEVINAGVPGYTSHQGLQHMRQELDRLKPDVVIASYANNDFWHWDNKTDREQATRLADSGIGQFIRRSRAVQVLDGWLSDRQVQSCLAENAEWAKATTFGYFEESPSGKPRVPLDHFEQNLIEMSKLCRSTRAKLVYVLWPDQLQAAGRWSKRIDYQDVIRKVAADRDHSIADVATEFQRNKPWSVRTYIPNDIVHVNKDGNRLAALAVERAVR